MKKATILFLLLFFTISAFAQQTVKMRPMRTRPQVHVKFGSYTISFAVTEIDRAMKFLPESGRVLYGASSGLDTALNYVIELQPGRHMEYLNKLQPLMQNGVGCFLLMGGRAVVENGSKTLREVIVKTGETIDMNGSYAMPVSFYDPKTDKLLFSGMMDSSLYKKDIGFD